MDLRRFIGRTAQVGQKTDLYYVFGKVGEAEFTEVSREKISLAGWIEISGITPRVPIKCGITLTGPNYCTVEVNSERDTKATYKVAGHLQVECKLFGKDIRIDLWQDGNYSNVRVFTWVTALWVLLAHVWTHPKAAVLGEGEEVALTFNPDLWPRLPESGETANP